MDPNLLFPPVWCEALRFSVCVWGLGLSPQVRPPEARPEMRSLSDALSFLLKKREGVPEMGTKPLKALRGYRASNRGSKTL